MAAKLATITPVTTEAIAAHTPNAALAKLWVEFVTLHDAWKSRHPVFVLTNSGVRPHYLDPVTSLPASFLLVYSQLADRILNLGVGVAIASGVDVVECNRGEVHASYALRVKGVFIYPITFVADDFLKRRKQHVRTA